MALKAARASAIAVGTANEEGLRRGIPDTDTRRATAEKAAVDSVDRTALISL
jgi:hypothetical protein